MQPFEIDPATHQYAVGTSFDQIIELYQFDKEQILTKTTGNMRNLLLLLLLITSKVAWAWDGYGTSESPYLIKTISDMYDLSERVNAGENYKGKFFLVKATTLDFDNNTEVFAPIGTYEHPFSGVLDGNGVHLQHLTIDRSEADYVGLFGYIGSSGIVKGLYIESSCSFKGSNYVGSVAGCALKAEIEDCHNQGVVIGKNYVGGVIGNMDDGGQITSCVNDGAIEGNTGRTGGIVGMASHYRDYYGGSYEKEKVYISYCVNNGSVTCNEGTVGGIVGYMFIGEVSNCTNNGEVNSQSANVGGIIGNCSGYARRTIISDCENTGDVKGQTSVGGIVGYPFRITLTGCKNKGSILGTGDDVGGIVGQLAEYNAHINNNENSGKVSSFGKYVGGIVGRAPLTPLEDCTNSGDVEGITYIGGVAGSCQLVKGCSNSGSVTGTSDCVAGIVGYAKDGIVSKCTNSGSVTSPGNCIAGIVPNQATPDSCENSGTINGNRYVAGIIAQGQTTNSKNTGSVMGTAGSVGGIVGSGYASKCINEGNVIGNGDVGGIVGYHSEHETDSCINTGHISGTAGSSSSNVGGVIGYMVGGSLTGCLNYGNVSGVSYGGAICGELYKTKSTLKENYYFRQVVVEATKYNDVYSGDTPRGIGYRPFPYDVTENNGAVMKDSDDAGIRNESIQPSVKNTYSINGIKGSHRGLNIIQYNDGNVRKVITK